MIGWYTATIIFSFSSWHGQWSGNQNITYLHEKKVESKKICFEVVLLPKCTEFLSSINWNFSWITYWKDEMSIWSGIELRNSRLINMIWNWYIALMRIKYSILIFYIDLASADESICEIHILMRPERWILAGYTKSC